MKLAILGGSFNPLHLGHLMLATTASTQYAVDKVLFVPALNPPHKHMAGGASAQDRLTMLEQTLCEYPNFAIEACELERKGKSYTIDTIAYLEQKYADSLTGKIGLIIGSDLARDFHLWKGADMLAQKTDILLASRPDTRAVNECVCSHAKKTEGSQTSPDAFPYLHKMIKNALLPISSGEIRQRIAKGQDWKALVPNCVYQYINDRNLYACK